MVDQSFFDNLFRNITEINKTWNEFCRRESIWPGLRCSRERQAPQEGK
jgi:hypothetical protein